MEIKRLSEKSSIIRGNHLTSENLNKFMQIPKLNKDQSKLIQ